MFEGCVLAVISIGLTIFNGVIIKCFDASRNLPTNMVLIRGVLQIVLYSVAVYQGNQSVIPSMCRERLIVVIKGVLKGILFMTAVAAIRFLPLGDVFTISSAEFVFCILFISIISLVIAMPGPRICTTCVCLFLVTFLGFYLFLYKPGDDSSTKELGPFRYALFLEESLSESTVTYGLVMISLNLCLTLPVNVLAKKIDYISPSIQSFWGGVGSLLVGIVASIYDSQSSLFSGSYSSFEFLVMLIISVSLILVSFLQDQALQFISHPTLAALKIVQIPVAYLICPNQERLPEFYTVLGIVFISFSGLVGEWIWIKHFEERVLNVNPYEEL